MAKTYKIAVIPGDGIGKEVTPWAQKALEKAAEGVADFEYENFDLGAERYLRDGAILPEDEEERIKANDAILLGAVGDPRIKAGILERGLLLKLRFDLDQYVNLRPSKLYKGVTSPLANPGDIDFVVVREGTEGLYCGAGGAVRRNTPQEVATEVSINTAYGVERVVRYAFKLAMKRKTSPWCTRRTCSSTPVICGSASSTRSARNTLRSPTTTSTLMRPPSSWSPTRAVSM